MTDPVGDDGLTDLQRRMVENTENSDAGSPDMTDEERTAWNRGRAGGMKRGFQEGNKQHHRTAPAAPGVTRHQRMGGRAQRGRHGGL